MVISYPLSLQISNRFVVICNLSQPIKKPKINKGLFHNFFYLSVELVRCFTFHLIKEIIVGFGFFHAIK